MSFTDDTAWDGFCTLIEEGWHGDFDDKARDAWRILLAPLTPEQASVALGKLMMEGRPHRPSPSEFLAAARNDPSVPTFDEALQAIRYALKAKGPSADEITRKTGSTFIDEDTEKRERRAAIQARLAEAHPLVGTFVARQGLGRLRNLPLDDVDWGEKTRRDLEVAWDEHVDTTDHRKVAELTERSGRGEPGKLDPIASLGLAPAKEPA